MILRIKSFFCVQFYGRHLGSSIGETNSKVGGIGPAETKSMRYKISAAILKKRSLYKVENRRKRYFPKYYICVSHKSTEPSMDRHMLHQSKHLELTLVF